MFEWLLAFWGWIKANATVFSALTSVGMLLIWAIYLQLLLHNFRMQRKPQIIINRGRGRDINSLCIISNMSQEAVFIETIIAQLETSRGTWFSDATDLVDRQHSQDERREEASDDVSYPLSRMTRQGPLNKGQYMESGTFGKLIRQIAREQGLEFDEHCRIEDDEIELQGIDIRLIAIFGSEKNPIGARRHFRFEREENGTLSIVPDMDSTRQLSTRRQQLEVRRWRKALK